MAFDLSLAGSYEYIHYTTEKLATHTPNGLWVSVTGINDWEQYCLKNNYRLENLKSEFQVMLKPSAKILILYNRSVFNDFLEEYGFYEKEIETPEKNYAFSLSISWERIISDYQGIVVPIVLPQFYGLNLWYKTWNCTCGVIWDLQAVEKAYKLD
jgi:hypothetical protein